MKKYCVNVHFDVVCPVEVVAESEEMALDLAEQIAWETDASNFEDFSLKDCCVTSVEEIDDAVQE